VAGGGAYDPTAAMQPVRHLGVSPTPILESETCPDHLQLRSCSALC